MGIMICKDDSVAVTADFKKSKNEAIEFCQHTENGVIGIMLFSN